MITKIRKKDLPDYVSVSPYLLKKTDMFFLISYIGKKFYVPATSELLKLVQRCGESIVEDFIRDMIHAMYQQVRDSVGAEIHSSLSQQIQNGFEKMYADSLERKIEEKFKKIESKHEALKEFTINHLAVDEILKKEKKQKEKETKQDNYIH